LVCEALLGGESGVVVEVSRLDSLAVGLLVSAHKSADGRLEVAASGAASDLLERLRLLDWLA